MGVFPGIGDCERIYRFPSEKINERAPMGELEEILVNSLHGPPAYLLGG